MFNCSILHNCVVSIRTNPDETLNLNIIILYNCSPVALMIHVHRYRFEAITDLNIREKIKEVHKSSTLIYISNKILTCLKIITDQEFTAFYS